MNWHQIKDRRTHEMHQVIANILRRSPEQLVGVQRWIDSKLDDPGYSAQGKDSLMEWRPIIESGVAHVLRVLEDEGEEAVRLRQSSPFASLMPEEERLRILEKYEPLRTRASLAGV